MLEYGNLNQDSIEQKYYKISPNPSSGQFTIIGKTSNKRISIYTLLGNLVYDQFIDEDHIKITMKDLKNGLYFYALMESHLNYILNRGPKSNTQNKKSAFILYPG